MLQQQKLVTQPLPLQLPLIQLPLNRIILGDALETLQHIPDNSIDCVITSPPYYQARDYKVDGQIGREKTVKDYIAKLITVFKQVYRILTPEGNCWINIGDKIDKKHYFLIPEQFAIEMINSGWKLSDKIIWHKANAMPSSAKCRYTVNYEYVYRFTKSKKYYFSTQYEPLSQVTIDELEKKYNGKAIKDYKSAGAPDPSQTKSNIIQSFNTGIRFGGKKAKNNGYDNRVYSGKEWQYKPATVKLTATDKRCAMKLGWDGNTDYAYWYFHLRQKKSFHNHSADSEKGMMQRKQGKVPLAYPYGHIKRSVWKISHGAFHGDHYSTFPLELVQECINSGCPKEVQQYINKDNTGTRKAIILDPFVGSGTTPLVAIRNKINFIGIDNSEKSVNIALSRIYDEWVNS